ncbi:MAG: acyl-CoA dehydrogenase [Zetaproteobacteria bacterium]|nr:acyl-CoA dehydrogenase [Zetaproteobacteria bacterium]
MWQWFFLCIYMLVVGVAVVRMHASLKQWTAGLLGSAVLLVWTSMVPSAAGWFLVLVLAMLLLPLHADVWRQKYLSTPLFHRLKKMLPPISQTEKEAMASGTTHWDAELFSGHPDWQMLLKIPKNQLSEAEQSFLDGEVTTFCSMLDDWHITHERHDLTPECWQYLKEHRFFGMIIPCEYGGLGFSAYAHSQVIQKISSRSLSAAVTVMVPNSLGPAELLLAYGTDAQQTHYLPRLAMGSEIPCFALTSPVAGSDATAMTDTGVVCRQIFEGEEVLGFCLNWEKRYITLGPVATLLGLAFHAYDPDGLLGEDEDLGMTCALIPTDTQGIDIGKRHNPMGAAFMNGPNSGENVFIPMHWLIGGAAYIGKGWQMLVERLAVGRGISLPALSVGAAKRVAQTTGAYAHIRQQFHRSIGDFEGVQTVLAEIAGRSYAMDATRLLMVSILDQGERPAVLTAISKYYLTESMRTVINHGMDVHGGRGICMGSSNYLAAMYQTIPIAITVEGANILTRSLMIFGQGIVRCHPFLQSEMEAMEHDDVELFDVLLQEHAWHFAQNILRSFSLGITSRWLQVPIQGALKPYAQQLARFSASFAVLSDVALMRLGGTLKRKEMLSGRFADALGYMYMASATIKHFEGDGCPERDEAVATWACQWSLYQVQEALYDVIHTLSLPCWMRLKLKLWVFPLGRGLHKPSDQLATSLALQLQISRQAREAWLSGLDENTEAEHITGRLEYALRLSLKAEPVEQRLRQQGIHFTEENQQDLCEQGVLTKKEVKLLVSKAKAVRYAIDVDDFVGI